MRLGLTSSVETVSSSSHRVRKIAAKAEETVRAQTAGLYTSVGSTVAAMHETVGERLSHRARNLRKRLRAEPPSDDDEDDIEHDELRARARRLDEWDRRL